MIHASDCKLYTIEKSIIIIIILKIIVLKRLSAVYMCIDFDFNRVS